MTSSYKNIHVLTTLHLPFSAACSSSGNQLLAGFSPVTLTSPGLLSSTCLWTIKSSYVNYAVEIKFTSFNVGSSSSCATNYLVIRDGSVQLAKACGNKKPPTIRSRGRYIYLTFVNSGSGSFTLTYKAVKLGKCQQP